MSTQAEGGFIGERLTQTVSELADVRERLKALGERLGEADNCLRFYADPRNYIPFRILDGNTVIQNGLKNDYSPSDNDPNTSVAGMRARVYLKKHASE